MCLDILKYPFKLCTNGHGICTGCAESLESCPTCQALFTAENTTLPLCVKNVLEVLPKFCCYSDAGCEDIVEGSDEHEMFCGFRPFRCQEKYCDVTLPLCKLMSHIEEIHEDNVWIMKTSNRDVTWENFSITGTKNVYYHTPIYLFNNWFWVVEEINIKEQCFEVTFYTTPICKPVTNHYLRITLDKGNFVYTNTLKPCEISSCVMEGFDKWHSLSGENNNVEIFKMKVPFNILKYFINEDSTLVFKYHFFTMPREK